MKLIHRILNLALLAVLAVFLGSLLFERGLSIRIVGGITFPAALLIYSTVASHKNYLVHLLGVGLMLLVLAAGGIIALYVAFSPAAV